MKNLLLFLLFILSLSMTGYSQDFDFSYDAAGNRTVREIVYLNRHTSNVEAPMYSSDSVLAINSIRVFPNPVDQFLILELSYENPQFSYTIINSEGKVVFDSQSKSNKTTINMSGLSPGVYILYITIEGKRKEWKIIKE